MGKYVPVKKKKKIKPKNNNTKQRWKKANFKKQILDSAKQVLKNKEDEKKEFEYPEIPHNTYFPCWRIFNFKNWAFLKKGNKEDEVHPGVVIAKENENYVLLQTTHSEKDGKRNNYLLGRLNPNDKKDSYIKKDIFVRTRNNTGSSITDAAKSSEERTDLRKIELAEQKEILKVINNKPSNRKRYYEEFVKYNNKKSDK